MKVLLAVRVALLWLLAASLTSAQMNMPGHPKTDAQKIADALRAGRSSSRTERPFSIGLRPRPANTES